MINTIIILKQLRSVMNLTTLNSSIILCRIETLVSKYWYLMLTFCLRVHTGFIAVARSMGLIFPLMCFLFPTVGKLVRNLSHIMTKWCSWWRYCCRNKIDIKRLETVYRHSKREDAGIVSLWRTFCKFARRSSLVYGSCFILWLYRIRWQVCSKHWSSITFK